MSFSYLNIGETRTMKMNEFDFHSINKYGKSNLSAYGDSIFAVNRLNHRYSVTRLLKTELELPLNQPVSMSMLKARAFRLKPDGSSKIPDLKGYHFTYNYEDYKITKTLKIS